MHVLASAHTSPLGDHCRPSMISCSVIAKVSYRSSILLSLLAYRRLVVDRTPGFASCHPLLDFVPGNTKIAYLGIQFSAGSLAENHCNRVRNSSESGVSPLTVSGVDIAVDGRIPGARVNISAAFVGEGNTVMQMRQCRKKLVNQSPCLGFGPASQSDRFTDGSGRRRPRVSETIGHESSNGYGKR